MPSESCRIFEPAPIDAGSIHIEHRPAVEATMVRGRNVETGKLDTVRITPQGVGEGSEVWQGVYNPSFDVTPAELISGSSKHWVRRIVS